MSYLDPNGTDHYNVVWLTLARVSICLSQPAVKDDVITEIHASEDVDAHSYMPTGGAIIDCTAHAYIQAPTSLCGSYFDISGY